MANYPAHSLMLSYLFEDSKGALHNCGIGWWSWSYAARVHLGAGGYFLSHMRADLQPIPPGSLLLRRDGILPWWIHQFHPTHAPDMSIACNPIRNVGNEEHGCKPITWWPQDVRDWRCASPASPFLTFRAPDPPTDDSTASANKIWTGCFWNVRYLM